MIGVLMFLSLFWLPETLHPEKVSSLPHSTRTHTGRFSIAYHAWDDPFRRFMAASTYTTYRPVTPRIGEVVRLADTEQTFSRWWEL